ncbi:MAG: DUF4194 domain-containing protein [Verrucomicrobiales bacterium]|nr:DUF4194 domain-containing protein [Verrucomicrobiota bacterium JB025]
MNEDSPFSDDAPAGLLTLPETERERLGEALQALLATGSINGLDPKHTALYHWCRQYLDWLREIAAISGLDVAILHEERLVQAIPVTASLRLRLRQDATLVWLALWYAADVRWRDEGMDQAFLSVAELNDLIQDQLLPDATGPMPRGSLRDILRQASRFNLIRFEAAEPFEESGIEVLPAIRRIIPFRDLAAWTETAAAFDRESADTAESTTPEEDES